jgi:hypothetical protein
MSVKERIQVYAKDAERKAILYSSSPELKIGNVEELKNTYVKILESGVYISPDDFLAYRMALDKLSRSNVTPLLAETQPGGASAAKLNAASAVTLITDKSPTAGLMDAFKLDKKNAEAEWKRAKQTMKQTAKSAKSK